MNNIKCKTKYCSRKVHALELCQRCYNREYRKKNILKSSYQILKDNAKRRKKDFNLTFDEFCEFCSKTKYISGKGRSRDSFTIDREDETKGYTADNIRILSNRENIRKYLDYKWNGVKMEFTTKQYRENKNSNNDCPF